MPTAYQRHLAVSTARFEMEVSWHHNIELNKGIFIARYAYIADSTLGY